MQLIAVTSGSLPTPFCFDPGNCISAGTVRYCFRGTNLPSSGFMTIRLTQGASTWSCTYDVTGGGGTLLPVQLTNFETRFQQGNALILWRTEQEFNSEKFEIERSGDNKTFIAIGSVSAQGTSSSPVNYEFRDVTPLKGVSFYRLKQIDTDKSFSYSMVKRVDNRINGIQVKQIFPNPATDKINLQLIINTPQILNTKIINSSGKQVFGVQRILQAGEQNWQLDVSRLSAGIYEIIIGNDSGAIISEKLIIR